MPHNELLILWSLYNIQINVETVSLQNSTHYRVIIYVMSLEFTLSITAYANSHIKHLCYSCNSNSISLIKINENLIIKRKYRFFFSPLCSFRITTYNSNKFSWSATHIYAKLNKLKLDRCFIFHYTILGSVIVRNGKQKFIFKHI